MKTVLCTGSEGFVGRHLCPKLEAAGYTLMRMDIKRDDPNRFNEESTFDILNNLPCEPYDVVVHLAAYIPPIDERLRDPLHVYVENLKLDVAMAEYVMAHPPREALILMSSCSIDSKDTDPYAMSKNILEKLGQDLYESGIPTVILRPFSGYGHDQADTYPFPAILKRALAHEDPLSVWGSGWQSRDFVHVEDLTDAIVWAIKDAPRGQVVEIGTGVGTSFLNLARMMADEVGYTPQIVGLTDKPESSAKRVARPKLAVEHGWRPKIHLKDGIKMAVEALRELA